MLISTLEISKEPKLTNADNRLKLITFNDVAEKNVLSIWVRYGMDRKNATVHKAKTFEVTNKACIKCGIIKPATPEYFRRDRKHLRGKCKLCIKISSKKWRENNPDKYKMSLLKNNERSKKWRINNRDQHNAYNKEWNRKNPDRVKGYEKAGYIKHKKKISERGRKKYQERKKLIEEENRRAIKEYEKRMQIK